MQSITCCRKADPQQLCNANMNASLFLIYLYLPHSSPSLWHMVECKVLRCKSAPADADEHSRCNLL
jgi:hypothetical protein